MACNMPEVLRTIFSPPHLNESGCFSMRLIMPGGTRYVLLDDFIMSMKNGGTPSLRSTNPKEAWPRLMEKLLSKVGALLRHASPATALLPLSLTQ